MARGIDVQGAERGQTVAPAAQQGQQLCLRGDRTGQHLPGQKDDGRGGEGGSGQEDHLLGVEPSAIIPERAAPGQM